MSELVAYIKKNPRRLEASSVRVLEVNRERHFGIGGRATLRASENGSGASLRIPARMVYPGREYTLLNSERFSREFMLLSGTAMEFKRLNGYVRHTVVCLPDDIEAALAIICRQTSR